MKLVFVCSPYRGNVEYNTSRAQGYCRFVQSQGCVPYAPHLHNPQFLDDSIPEEREAGIKLGLQILVRADEMWLFGSRLTEGMEAELKAALRLNKPIRYFNDKCREAKK
ncbi:MAG: DUF4406 domain-containing protein [Dethiobacter sp.]|jgi:hypothetical protein|nr:MAG: DUF4406 domain-containing protein [Dethiobacter sp.]